MKGDGKIDVHTVSAFTGKDRTRVINFSGHIEDDFRLITSFIKLINGTLENKEDVTFIDATIPSHKIIMAAEESRHNGGMPVDLTTFFQE